MSSSRALFTSPPRPGRVPGRRRVRDAVDAPSLITDVRAGYAGCYLAGAVHADLQSGDSSARPVDLDARPMVAV